MFFISRSQSPVLFLRKRAAFLASGFLKERFPVRETGTDPRGEVSLGIWVVLFVCVWEVCSEPGGTRNDEGECKKNSNVMSFGT